MARSMLSSGTDSLRALTMASARVGLPAGSPPPVRAATSMVLMSFANALPRLASFAAFWCLVVAHLECPLMAPRLPARQHAHEQRVHAHVRRELGMERRGEQRALPDRDGVAVDGGEHLHPGTDALDPRRSDEDGVERLLAEPGHGQVGLERVHLPPERVAP